MATAARKFPRTKSKKHLLLGEAPELMRDMHGWMIRSVADAGDIFQAKVPNHPLIVTSRPEYFKHFLLDNHKNYVKSMGYQVLKLFLGQGLLTSEGDFWLRQRRLAQPAFHRKRLAALASTMTQESARVAEQWRAAQAAGKPIGMHHEMMTATMRIVARSLFSANVSGDISVISDNLDLLNHLAVKRITSPVRLPLWIPTRISRQFRHGRKEIDAVIYRIIEARRGNTQDHDDLLSMLMDARDEDTGETMDNQQLRDECMTIFVAGHETTALAMTWTWVLLSEHPEMAGRLREETAAVLGGRAAEMKDLPNLPYTRFVIDEVMRLYPPAWIVGRKALQTDILDGYTIPRGSNVLMAPFITHRRPDIWEAPEAFRPERWEDGLAKKLPKFAYLPFGGGPRLCIGNNFALMEMAILLATLAQEFQPKLLGPVPALDPLITLRPKGEVRMQFATLPANARQALAPKTKI